MSSVRPLRLLRQQRGVFTLVDLRHTYVESYDIISHRWYPAETKPYGYDDKCGADGRVLTDPSDPEKELTGHKIQALDWTIDTSREKIAHIKDFMIAADLEYLWVDCICIKQDDEEEKAGEVPKMFEYYKAAQTCHILMKMPAVWDPKEMVHELKFVDHVMYHMGGLPEALGWHTLAVPDSKGHGGLRCSRLRSSQLLRDLRSQRHFAL
jgi:hypothetical protein